MADDPDSGRKLRAKQRKRYNDQDIDEDDIDGRRMYSVEEKLLCDQFDADMVQELKGSDFTMEWLQKNGLSRPIVFYDKTGLGLRVPSENFKVSDVKQCVGSRRILDVMDVNTQKAMELSMKEWVKYYENPERDRLLNVISLEFCHTRLENYVESPTLVRQIDWVDRAWPKHLKECQTESTNLIERMKYPKVQKYCLMSVSGCYTDFHIDFGGTSVWYHILHGEKIFWLAPPSQKNIDRYVEWTLSAKQGDAFLGDTLECCQRIQLRAGYTFIIPSGWIHAVYTPKDSLVFGGNFLHSYNVDNQLLAARVEEKTYVPNKFKYPFYHEIMWYVVDRYLSCLTGRTYLVAGPGDKEDGYDDDDQGLIQVDEDSRPPSRNPDSRPPSRAMEEVKSEKEEETPRLSKSVMIELTRIDATALKRSPSEDENQPPAFGRPRGPRKAASDPNNSWEGGGVRKWVHLTAKEHKGVSQLVDYLSGVLALSTTKRGVPKELLEPEALLKELKQILDDHKDDDQELAVTGEPVIGWPEMARKKQKLKLGYKTFKSSKGARGGQNTASPAASGTNSSNSNAQRRRRQRCKKCEACTRTECGECTFCKDMKKFGGPGRMKQTCISRQCMAPILPSVCVCAICNQGDQVNPDDPDDVSTFVMECGICWEIVHPRCLRKKYENLDNEGVINEDLPSSWECLKCCNDGKQGQLKMRPKPGAGSSMKRLKMEDSSHLSADSEGSQEEEGGGPLSPVSPTEGKRVTAKERSNGSSLGKAEAGSQERWASPTSGKLFSTISESSMKKEDGRSSHSPHALDENFQSKKALPFSSHKDQKRMIKREKSPSKQQHSEDSPHGPRKRHTPDPGSSHPLQNSGSKRPKREKKANHKKGSGNAENGNKKRTERKGHAKQSGTKRQLQDVQKNGVEEVDTGSESFKTPTSTPKKTCMITNGSEKSPPAKIRKRVSFRDSQPNLRAPAAQESPPDNKLKGGIEVNSLEVQVTSRSCPRSTTLTQNTCEISTDESEAEISLKSGKGEPCLSDNSNEKESHSLQTRGNSNDSQHPALTQNMHEISSDETEEEITLNLSQHEPQLSNNCDEMESHSSQTPANSDNSQQPTLTETGKKPQEISPGKSEGEDSHCSRHYDKQCSSTNRFDPIRGHRAGRRPVYKGNADWSQEYNPPTAFRCCRKSIDSILLKSVGLENRSILSGKKEQLLSSSSSSSSSSPLFFLHCHSEVMLRKSQPESTLASALTKKSDFQDIAACTTATKLSFVAGKRLPRNVDWTSELSSLPQVKKKNDVHFNSTCRTSSVTKTAGVTDISTSSDNTTKTFPNSLKSTMNKINSNNIMLGEESNTTSMNGFTPTINNNYNSNISNRDSKNNNSSKNNHNNSSIGNHNNSSISSKPEVEPTSSAQSHLASLLLQKLREAFTTSKSPHKKTEQTMKKCSSVEQTKSLPEPSVANETSCIKDIAAGSNDMTNGDDPSLLQRMDEDSQTPQPETESKLPEPVLVKKTGNVFDVFDTKSLLLEKGVGDGLLPESTLISEHSLCERGDTGGPNKAKPLACEEKGLQKVKPSVCEMIGPNKAKPLVCEKKGLQKVKPSVCEMIEPSKAKPLVCEKKGLQKVKPSVCEMIEPSEAKPLVCEKEEQQKVKPCVSEKGDAEGLHELKAKLAQNPKGDANQDFVKLQGISNGQKDAGVSATKNSELLETGDVAPAQPNGISLQGDSDRMPVNGDEALAPPNAEVVSPSGSFQGVLSDHLYCKTDF